MPYVAWKGGDERESRDELAGARLQPVCHLVMRIAVVATVCDESVEMGCGGPVPPR